MKFFQCKYSIFFVCDCKILLFYILRLKDKHCDFINLNLYDTYNEEYYIQKDDDNDDDDDCIITDVVEASTSLVKKQQQQQ